MTLPLLILCLQIILSVTLEVCREKREARGDVVYQGGAREE